MKKLLKQLQELTDRYGYWSKEVYDFNNKVPYHIRVKINNLVKR